MSDVAQLLNESLRLASSEPVVRIRQTLQARVMRLIGEATRDEARAKELAAYSSATQLLATLRDRDAEPAAEPILPPDLDTAGQESAIEGSPAVVEALTNRIAALEAHESTLMELLQTLLTRGSESAQVQRVPALPLPAEAPSFVFPARPRVRLDYKIIEGSPAPVAQKAHVFSGDGVLLYALKEDHLYALGEQEDAPFVIDSCIAYRLDRSGAKVRATKCTDTVFWVGGEKTPTGAVVHHAPRPKRGRIAAASKYTKTGR